MKLEQILHPPQPGDSSGQPIQLPHDQQYRYMTVEQLLKTVAGIPYYNNVVDDYDDNDYSWSVTKKVVEYANYLKQHPDISKLPPIIVVNGQLQDGAHRISAIWLLMQRLDKNNPTWKNAKLKVAFVEK